MYLIYPPANSRPFPGGRQILDDVVVQSNLLHPWDMYDFVCWYRKTSFDTKEAPLKLLRFLSQHGCKTYLLACLLFEHFEPLSTSYFSTTCVKSTRDVHPVQRGHPIRLHFAISAAAGQATRNHHEYRVQALCPSVESALIWAWCMKNLRGIW